MSKANVENPLEFLNKRKEKRKKKTNENDFFQRRHSSKPPSRDYRGFRDPFLTKSQSYDTYSESSQRFGTTSSNSYSGPPDPTMQSSQDTLLGPSQSSNINYSQDQPLPIISETKTNLWRQFLRRKSELLYKEVNIESQTLNTLEPSSQLLEELESIPKDEEFRLHFRNIYIGFKNLIKCSSLFPPFDDHFGLLIRQMVGRGALHTRDIRNPRNFPIFINSVVFSLESVPEAIEFLPIKRNDFIEPQHPISKPNNREDAYTESIWEKLLMELVLVRAEKNLPAFLFENFMGYETSYVSSGEKIWIPLFIASDLCNKGMISLELPSWLNIDKLRGIKDKEESEKSSLTHLDSEYFFEIAYLFGLFRTRTKHFFNGKVNFKGPRRGYISKARGLIEKIYQVRESKIVDRMKHLTEASLTAFIIPEIQLFETFTVNELLSVIWDKDLDFTNEDIYPKVKLITTFDDIL